MLLDCTNDPVPRIAMRLRHGGIRVFAMADQVNQGYNYFTECGGVAATGSEDVP